MNYGVVLEGGGARGAYHMGATKAMQEKGYNIVAVTGTSIGSINGAMIVQGDADIAYKMWENIKYDTIFSVNDNKIQRALSKNIDLDIVKYMSRKISNMVKNGGADTQKMRELLTEYINEDKIRSSSIPYGLVTFSLTEKKPYELFKEDIPKGQMIDYILASSRLPGFKQEPIGENFFIDGGVYNNCPVNMLVDKGFKNIIAIRCTSNSKIKDIDRISKMKDVNLTIIEPRGDMPSILSFDNKTANKLLKRGYYDALKVFDKLDGFDYYFNPLKEEMFLNSLVNFDSEELNKIYEGLGIKNTDSKKSLFETVIPVLLKKIGFKETKNYKEAVYALVEYVALKENIEQYNVYDIQDMLNVIKPKIKFKDKNKLDQAIYRFVKYLEI